MKKNLTDLSKNWSSLLFLSWIYYWFMKHLWIWGRADNPILMSVFFTRIILWLFFYFIDFSVRCLSSSLLSSISVRIENKWAPFSGIFMLKFGATRAFGVFFANKQKEGEFNCLVSLTESNICGIISTRSS